MAGEFDLMSKLFSKGTGGPKAPVTPDVFGDTALKNALASLSGSGAGQPSVANPATPGRGGPEPTVTPIVSEELRKDTGAPVPGRGDLGMKPPDEPGFMSKLAGGLAGGVGGLGEFLGSTDGQIMLGQLGQAFSKAGGNVWGEALGATAVQHGQGKKLEDFLSNDATSITADSKGVKTVDADGTITQSPAGESALKRLRSFSQGEGSRELAGLPLQAILSAFGEKRQTIADVLGRETAAAAAARDERRVLVTEAGGKLAERREGKTASIDNFQAQQTSKFLKENPPGSSGYATKLAAWAKENKVTDFEQLQKEVEFRALTSARKQEKQDGARVALKAAGYENKIAYQEEVIDTINTSGVSKEDRDYALQQQGLAFQAHMDRLLPLYPDIRYEPAKGGFVSDGKLIRSFRMYK